MVFISENQRRTIDKLEEWHPIAGFPGYEISDRKRIRRISKITYLKPYKGTIVLSKENKQYHLIIEALYRKAFE